MADLKSIAVNKGSSFKSTKPTNNVPQTKTHELEKSKQNYQSNYNPVNNVKKYNGQPEKDNLGKQIKDVTKMAANPNSVPEERQEELAKEAFKVAAEKAATAYGGQLAGAAASVAAEKFNKTEMGEKTAKKTVKLFKTGRAFLIFGIVIIFASLIITISGPIILISKTVGGNFKINNKNVLSFIDGGKNLNEETDLDYNINDNDYDFSKTLFDGTEYCDLINCGEETGGSSSSEVASYISSETTYIVQAGDTLESIAAKFGVSVESLKAINNLADDYVLSEGAILKIPLATLPIDIAEGKSWQDYAGNRRFDMNGTAACYNMNGDKLSDTGCNHGGIDFNRLGIDTGTPVYSLAKGTVYEAVYGDSTYGFYVSIGYDTDGDGKYDYYSLYAHLSKISVSKGDAVNAGQKVGEVGSTGRSSGPHLHFEIRNDDYNRVDPAPILDKIEKGESVLSTAV